MKIYIFPDEQMFNFFEQKLFVFFFEISKLDKSKIIKKYNEGNFAV